MLACARAQAPFSKPQQQQLAKDLGALSTLASLHLAASGQPAYNFVEFISHKRKYILATDAGIAARRRVASFLSAEALCSLRRPSLHAD